MVQPLLLLPQRYVFSSKSQPFVVSADEGSGCCCYHKGTYFQANHNVQFKQSVAYIVVVATTKVRIFKQITTVALFTFYIYCCCCYHKGTYFQANHNEIWKFGIVFPVVVATTKVRIFKQITTVFTNNGIIE